MDFKNLLKYSICFGSLIVLTACPAPILDPGNCETILLPNKGVFSPEEKVFSVGDTITLNISFPAEITKENSFLNIFETYKADSSTTSIFLSNLLNENTYNLIEGQLIGENFEVIVNYSENTNSYDFLCEVVLSRKGFYFQDGAEDIKIRFGDNSSNNCSEKLIIETNIENIDQDGPNVGDYTFTVE